MIVNKYLKFIYSALYESDIDASNKKVTWQLQTSKGETVDPAKIKKDLGWYPETTFAVGIEKTVLWNLENRKWIGEVTSGDYQKYYEHMYGNR